MDGGDLAGGVVCSPSDDGLRARANYVRLDSETMGKPLELPAEVRVEAEARATRLGITLEEFVTEAVEHALRLSDASPQERAKIPLIPGKDGP